MRLAELKNYERELYLFQLRVGFAGVVVLIAFGLLFARFFHLQVVQHDTYAAKAEDKKVLVKIANCYRELGEVSVADDAAAGRGRGALRGSWEYSSGPPETPSPRPPSRITSSAITSVAHTFLPSLSS